MFRFSIIIPTFNLENYIEETLQSILANDLSACEIILIDSSTDNTMQIAETTLSNSGFSDYKILRKENTGVSDARNVGINEANGEYLIFCDGDDFFTKDLIDKVRKETANANDMIAWRYYITQGKKQTVSQNEVMPALYSSEEVFRKFLLEGYKIRLGSFAIKRDIIVQEKIEFTSGCNFAEDVEFMIKCMWRANSIRFMEDVLFIYAKRLGSLMYSYNIKRFDALRAIRRTQEWVYSEVNPALDEELDNYFRYGYFVLHFIYSMDACINLSNIKKGTKLYQEYMEKYADVDQYLKTAVKRVQPFMNLPKKKIKFLSISRRCYVIVYVLKNRLL